MGMHSRACWGFRDLAHKSFARASVIWPTKRNGEEKCPKVMAGRKDQRKREQTLEAQVPKPYQVLPPPLAPIPGRPHQIRPGLGYSSPCTPGFRALPGGTKHPGGKGISQSNMALNTEIINCCLGAFWDSVSPRRSLRK